MEINITEEKNNALFSRREIKGTVEAEITPSRAEILIALAKKFSVPEENIKIKGIRSRYGSKVFNIESNLYSSKDEKDAVEIQKKKEQPKAALTKVEEVKIEEPAEAEEIKPEEKSEKQTEQ